MSTWEGYAVECKFGTVPILAQDVQRTIAPRVSTFDTPGMDAAITTYHGRKGFEDRVTALIPIANYKVFEALVTTDAPQLWQHPVMAPFVGRITDLSVPASSALIGYFMVTFTVKEHRDAGKKVATPSSSASGAKAAASSIFDGLLDDMDGLGDLATLDSSGALSSSWSNMETSWSSLDDTFDSLISGDSVLSDLSSAVDSFETVGDTFIDAVREVEDDVGALVRDIQTAPLRIVQGVRDTIGELRASASRTARVMITDTTDVFTILSGLGVSPDKADAVMRDAGIFDPFCVLAGTRIEVPV
jgi:hypothetical protein